MGKIVFIACNEYVPWGGSESCWAAAAEKLARRNFQVGVSVKYWDKPVPQVDLLRSLGCQIFYRLRPSLLGRAKRRYLSRRSYAWEHMKKIGAGADLIVISQGGNIDGLPWMEAAQSHGIPYAIISQSAAEQWWPDDDTADRLAISFENASAAYFVSEANLRLTSRQLATPLPRARVIRNPFKVRYDACPVWPAQASELLSLACVGRLDVVQKSQDLLLQVLSLPHWRSRNIQLTLAGTGVNERLLRRMAEMLNLSNVHFTGFVDDIEKLWSTHHALVLPSRYEGMPLALVEAMLCGRPAIVTDVAGHRELVRDGHNGFFAKAPTVDLLNEAMDRAWNSREKLKDMGRVAAEDVRRWVTPDPVEDLVRGLTEAMAGKNGHFPVAQVTIANS